MLDRYDCAGICIRPKITKMKAYTFHRPEASRVMLSVAGGDTGGGTLHVVGARPGTAST